MTDGEGIYRSMVHRGAATLLILCALIFTGIGGPGLVGRVMAESTHASAQVCSTLTQDTTWAPSGNPYQITCPVVVPAGVTLTILPGVTISGLVSADSMIQIQGTLIANGTAAAPITFSWDLTSTKETGIWFQTGASSASSISYADLSGSPNGALIDYPGPVLDHISIHDNSVYGLDTVVTGVGGAPNSLQITNSSFFNNTYSVSVDVGNGSFTMTNSKVSNPADGGTYSDVYLTGVTGSNIHLHENNILTHQGFSLQLIPPDGTNESNLQIDVTNNYWGTTDLTAIQQEIDDCHYSDLGTIHSTHPCAVFVPVLDSAATASSGTTTPTPVVSTTSISSLTPTPTTTPTPTATATATATSSPTSTGTPGPSPTPTVTGTATRTPSPTATLISSSLSTATPTSTRVGTPANTPTSTPQPTNTVVVDPVPAPTKTRTATPTPAHTRTATSTPTAAPVTGPHSFFAIDKVQVLHKVSGRTLATQTVKVGESAIFSMQYHPVISNTLPLGTLTITKNGHVWHSYSLLIDVAIRSGHIEATYHTSVPFKRGSPVGKLYAHFKIALGGAVAKRDRKFFVSAT